MYVLNGVGGTVDKFDAPLYTQAEAARFLGHSASTFRNWARGYHTIIRGREVTGAPVLTALGKPGHRGPNIPFVGLAEGYALRQSVRVVCRCGGSAPPWSASTRRWV